jgi:tryptophan-rich sensory protein
MTLTTVLALLLGLASYLLIGMILTHHAPLGRKYYRNTPIRLTFFWIIPIAWTAIFVMGLFIVQMADEVLFDCLPGEGLGSIFEK